MKVVSATKLSGGINNPTYKLICENNSKYILQFSGHNHPDKAKKQPLIVNLLNKKTNLPVAKIVKADTSRSIINKDYVILEFLQGSLLKQAGKSFTTKEIVKLYAQIAKYLGSLHSVKQGGFGPFIVANNKLKIMPRYGSAKKQIFNEYYSWIKNAKNTPFEKFMDDLIAWLKKNIIVFGSDIKPCLTHNDFSNTNILVLKDGSIS